ncbi:MAG: hypothetical protein FJ125_14090, partial [Deltaproteobacteria bacterium]|nr:hypothetical protein [Deltaproteobacteria bacterium]
MLLPVAAVTGCGETAEQAASDGGLPDAGDQLCGVDANNDRQGAVELVPGEAVSEFICTRNDVDWYRFILPPGQPILEVRLSNQVELTPVTYRYALLDAAGRQVPGVEGQDPRRGRGRVQLADRHHVPVAGVYYLVVRDENGVEVDRFNPYTLSISLAPDPDPFEPAERPEERADAILLGAGAQGRFLSHGGDVDWFAIEARAGELLRVLLRTAERAEIRPRYRLFTADGTTPFAGARVEPPEGEPGGGWRTERVHAVPAAGRILIEVADEESLRGDLDAGYALEASTLP